MLRTCLIWSLCIALVLLGASGLHGHVSGPASREAPPHAHEHDAAAEGHLHAEQDADHGLVVTVFDVDHFHTHEHHGDIDIDPLAKAFGKAPPNLSLTALLFVGGLVWLLHAPARSTRTHWPPRRPPKVRFRPHLLPPSHAPPAAT